MHERFKNSYINLRDEYDLNFNFLPIFVQKCRLSINKNPLCLLPNEFGEVSVVKEDYAKHDMVIC